MSTAVTFIAALAATVGVYLLARNLYARLGAPALLHPALTSILALGFGLSVLGVEHDAYFAAAWPIHAALVPMTVLLAVPLCRQRAIILAAFGKITAVVMVGCAVTVLISGGLAVFATSSEPVVLTLLAKSVTTAVAVAITQSIGGLPELTPAIVIATGIVGACVGPSVCRLLRVEDDRAIGLALGVAAHAIGTARAFQISQTAGAYATLGLVLNAILTSVAVAFLFALT